LQGTILTFLEECAKVSLRVWDYLGGLWMRVCVMFVCVLFFECVSADVSCVCVCRILNVCVCVYGDFLVMFLFVSVSDGLGRD